MPFDHFDFIAPYYDKYFLTAPIERLVELLQPNLGGIALDIGGGTGRAAAALSEKGMVAAILDPSFKMLLNSKDKSIQGRIFGTSEEIPFATGSIDRIVIVDAFHHVADQSASIAEMARALKPGGRLMVVDPDIRYLTTKILAVLEKVILMRSKIISGERIAAMCHDNGLIAEEIREERLSWVVADKPA
ncbi:MAG TPA: methyltransferase domain-containing protein [Bellilinea sp.]|nr:methyltransferase domain-containing protein [Bellilinea sp.]